MANFIVIRETPKGNWIKESRYFENYETALDWMEWVKTLFPRQEVFIVSKET